MFESDLMLHNSRHTNYSLKVVADSRHRPLIIAPENNLPPSSVLHRHQRLCLWHLGQNLWLDWERRRGGCGGFGQIPLRSSAAAFIDKEYLLISLSRAAASGQDLTWARLVNAAIVCVECACVWLRVSSCGRVCGCLGVRLYCSLGTGDWTGCLVVRQPVSTYTKRYEETHKLCFSCFCAATAMFVEWTGAINPCLCPAAFDYQVSVNVKP